jgi:hypothetical protein
MIDTIVSSILIYLAIGAAFAAYFMVAGARDMDPGHGESSLVARLVLLPGVVALWPYLLMRLLTGAQFKG